MILLDTHVWVWWVSEPDRLSDGARARVTEASAAADVFVSAISAWEVALLVAKGRLALTLGVEEWIGRSEALPYLRFLPVDHRIAMRAVNLPQRLHADPADRMIVATALVLQAEVVTKDRRLHDYPAVGTIW